MSRILDVDCCVAGGGPAGVMAGLLFARAGCRTVVLEKHADFLRDFRGDTVHPSTLEVMHELGLLESFLERPHDRMSKLAGVFGGQRLDVTDFSSLPTKCKFIAFMPQWHFLDFLSEKAGKLPTFSIEMRGEVTSLIEDPDGRISGVEADTPNGPLTVRSKLVIGADGRHSRIRDEADLKVKNIGAPIDVIWFRIPREETGIDEPLANAGKGHVLITIDRGDYFQCAYVIPKGAAEKVMVEGIEKFRNVVTETAPRLSPHISSLTSFDDVSLLTVTIDRLENWSRPGLLMIGDAAHAMSPVGGIGINLAIQDAVAAANLLSGALADGTLKDEDLVKVQRRRQWPTKATQFFQVEAQNNIITPLIANSTRAPAPPLPLRVVSKVPWLQRRLAALVGLGVRPEHVNSPARFQLQP